MEDTKRLGPFRGVPLQAGEVPRFKDLTPIQRGATLQPEQAEVWRPLSRQRLTVVN